ncbi:hypothetical protein CALVIDRAFT_533398, partial [Calocera viscosa TUFC12733]
MLSTRQLNEDLFSAVVDEVIGQLNMYQDNDTMRLALTLSLLCTGAYAHIQPVAARYVDFVFRPHFTQSHNHKHDPVWLVRALVWVEPSWFLDPSPEQTRSARLQSPFQ